MRLLSLRLRNWLLFRDASIDFDGVGSVIGIAGEYADEAARSNRAGKSSITEAIPYLFYGKGRGKQIQLVNRSALDDGEDMAVTGVVHCADGRQFTITRGRTAANKPILEVEGLDGAKVKEADVFLTELIGEDYEEYKTIGFFGQGDIHAFMAAQPAQKRELIQRWLHQDRWSERQAYADTKERECRAIVDGYRMALASLPKSEASLDDLAKALAEAQRKQKKAQASLEKAQAIRDEAKGRLAQLEREEEDMARLASLLGKVRKAKADLEEARRKSKARQKWQAKVDRYREEWRELKELTDAEIDKRREKVAECKGELASIGSRLDKLSGLDGVCPFLESSCSRVGSESLDPIREDAGVTKRRLGNLEDALSAYEMQASVNVGVKWSAVRDAERKVRAAQHTPVKQAKAMLGDLLSEVRELEQRTTNVAGRSSREELEAELAESGQAVRVAVRLVSDTSGEAARIESEFSQAKKAKQRRAEIESQIERDEKDRACWAYCKYMFGPRGIPGAIMEASFETLEGDINFILERMNTNLSVRFLPYRETQKWEGNCIACGWQYEATKQRTCGGCGEARQRKRVDQLVLQVVDEFEGQISEFGLDSGGGKTLLSFAVRLALMFLKVRQSSGDIPPVVLDEVLADLDPINRAAVLDLVTNVLVKKYGVEQVLVISHNREVQEAIEDVLVVTRHNFHSEVKWA